MYAVLTTGGKQVKVAKGDHVRVEKIEAPVGDRIELGDIRLVANDGGIVVDPAKLAGAKVVCEVTCQGRAKKILIYKKKRRKGYQRTNGHRQSYTQLKVTDIVL
ncbi:MAG TPA: 50S ribosomal protein L21 [Candidatus Hydrogenedentes bacterium]|nr:50S ribosomal protein L21 [Candidatus Hydrogenedentota bacterium]